MISMLALSWFHVVHAPTVLRALGVEAADPAFREERRRHVVNLVVQGVRGRLSGGDSSGAQGTPASAPSARNS